MINHGLRIETTAPAEGPDALPPIPGSVASLDVDLNGQRQRIDTTGPIWLIRQSADGGDVLKLSFHTLCSHVRERRLSRRALHLMQLFLADRIRRKKAFTVRGDLDMFSRFLGWRADIPDSDASTGFEWADLTEGTARAFLEHGLSTHNRGNDFARLRHFYSWGVAKQFSDFDPALLRILRRVRAPGNVKGTAVRFRDAEKGPFDAQELRDLRAAATNPAVPGRSRAVLMLFLEWGTNPNQLARLRNRDLRAYPSPADPQDYKLFVPRNKKGTAHRETRARRISTRLGQLLSSLQKGGPDDRLLYWVDSDEPTRGLGKSLRTARTSARIFSHRIQGPLRVNPRRFRYTLATEISAQGASDEQIADVLDHSDTQNVRVYAQFNQEGMKRAARAIDGSLEPIVDAFLGIVIESPEDRPFPGIPQRIVPGSSPHLPEFGLDLGGIGVCGHNIEKQGLCTLMQPVQCYRCRKFAAFRDGPHEKVRAALESARTRLRQDADPRVAAQLDEILLALSQLLDQLGAEPPLVQILAEGQR
jgi:hypothetical protein